MYREMIAELHNRLINRADIEIHSFEIHAPVDEVALDDLDKSFKLSRDLLNFYKELNGFQISYTFKDNMDFDKDKFGYYDTSFPKMWPNENYWHLDGCVNVLPIDFILRNSWKDYIWFGSQTENFIQYRNKAISQLAFEKQLRPFDIFSKSSIVVFYVHPEGSDILLGVDHNASFIDYEPIQLGEYLDGIIRTDGLIDKRKEIFKVKL